MNVASLLVPALPWDATNGFAYLRGVIEDALEVGVGGFIIRGGPRQKVGALAAALQGASREPLLLAADAERGAGEQFSGCTELPPLAALGALARHDPSGIARRAARITARELKALGLNWALGPVCDLDLPPGSPVISVRSPGADPEAVAAFAGEWVDACQAEGVMACAKHFPGHGRARGDSHLESSIVAERPELIAQSDLAPFRAVIDGGVASIMVSHVRYPTLDSRDLPATLSAPIVTRLLRESMEFEGLIVSDSVDMRSVLALGSEAAVCVSALAAGCDVLLGVADPQGTAEAITRAITDGALDRELVRRAIERRARWAGWASSSTARETALDDVMWVRQIADRSVHMVRGEAPRLGQAVEVVVVDEDSTGPWPPRERGMFESTLRALEMDAPVVSEPTAHTRVPVLIALYCDVIAWKGYDAPSEVARAAVSRAIAVAAAQKRDACVVLFGHPRHAASLPDAPRIACAWEGTPVMQAAAARALARGLLHRSARG